MTLFWIHLQLFTLIFSGFFLMTVLRNLLGVLASPVNTHTTHERQRRNISQQSLSFNSSAQLVPTMPGRTLPLQQLTFTNSATGRRAGMLVSSILFLSASSIPSAWAAEPWASFQNGGQMQAATPLPQRDWSQPLPLDWKVELTGYGQSSPVIWDNQVYITSVSGPQKENYHLTAYSLQDGKQLWQTEFANPSPQENNSYVSRSAPTPAADKNGVICFSEGGNLLALTADGKPRWERNLVTEFGPISGRHGISASLEQNADSVFVWVERETEPYVLCVDKVTGQDRWKVAGLGVTSWASPRLINVAADTQHLVLSGIGKIIGINPQDGQLLWTFTDVSGNSTPTPMPAGEGRFLIGATVGREGGEAGRSAESNGLIEIRQQEDKTWSAEYVWRAKRATSSFGSPLAAGSVAYFVNRTGVLYGLDLQSGEELFAERIGDSVWATPFALGEAVLFFGKKGTLDVIRFGKEFQALGNTAFWADEPASEEAFAGPVLYAAAITGPQLLIRRGDRLESYQLTAGE